MPGTSTRTSPSDARPRGVLVDDQPIVTDGLRRLLEPEYTIVAVVSDGEALIEVVRALRPDFVIADISMPRRNGIDAIRAISKEFPQIPGICLTVHADRIYLVEALEAGAAGFVAKHAATSELREAIRAVLSGSIYVSPLVGDRGRQARRALTQGRPGGYKLSARQGQVLQLLAEGRTLREVAATLDIAPKTVEYHKYRMMECLGLRTSAELVQYAIRHGMVLDRPGEGHD